MRKFPLILVLLMAVAFWTGCWSNNANSKAINLSSTPDKAEQIIKEREAANANSQRR